MIVVCVCVERERGKGESTIYLKGLGKQRPQMPHEHAR